MKAKKAKDFEDELIDDLLGSDDDGELSEKSANLSLDSGDSSDEPPTFEFLDDSGQPSDDKTTPIKVTTDDEDVDMDLSRSDNLSEPENSGSQEKTTKIPNSNVSRLIDHKSNASRSAQNFDHSVRTSVGGKMAMRPGAKTGLGLSSDAALIQSENLRVAQQKIFELEEEIERLRGENEQLAAAAETIKRRSDEMQSQNDISQTKLDEMSERFHSEKEILEGALKAKDLDLQKLKLKNEEFEMRLSNNLQKIRVRERDLENRLELVKMESTAVVRSKDEMILDLKRQADQLTSEIENYRAKGQDLHRQLDEKQEAFKRTVKALRLALGMLEGIGEDADLLKKAK